MPAAGRPEGTGNDEGMGMQARLAAVERSVRAMADEIRTKRLVVVDELGRVRLVTEVVGETTELRLELPGDTPGDRATGADNGAASRNGEGGPRSSSMRRRRPPRGPMTVSDRPSASSSGRTATRSSRSTAGPARTAVGSHTST